MAFRRVDLTPNCTYLGCAACTDQGLRPNGLQLSQGVFGGRGQRSTHTPRFTQSTSALNLLVGSIFRSEQIRICEERNSNKKRNEPDQIDWHRIMGRSSRWR